MKGGEIMKLTKDADALICVLYREYLSRRKDDISKNEAKMFAGAAVIQSEFMPNLSLEDVEETCWELARAEYLDTLDADNTVETAWLTDTAIIYMENRFKNGLKEVAEFISKFIP